LFAGVNGTLRVGVLPVPLFANGHVYFVQRLPQALKVEPYAVHAVHQFSGTEGKRHRFREGMLWVDGPEYYTPKGEGWGVVCGVVWCGVGRLTGGKGGGNQRGRWKVGGGKGPSGDGEPTGQPNSN
jgi:hypothetical protein